MRGKAHGWPSTIRRRPSWHAGGTCAALACGVCLLRHSVMGCLVILPYEQGAQDYALGPENSLVGFQWSFDFGELSSALDLYTSHLVWCTASLSFQAHERVCTCDDKRLRAAVR